MSSLPDLAYYYPAPYWGADESGWIKTLLLFFDKVGILLPSYMYGQHHFADPTLSATLEHEGLLEVLEPGQWIDEPMALQLAEVMVELLANEMFDSLPTETPFHELSYSRIGYGADVELADFLVDELQNRGLAKPSEDGVSIPMHPVVRTTILVLLGQLSRAHGPARGYAVHPITSHRGAIDDLIRTLSMERMPSRDKLVVLDLEPVCFDMDEVPLEEVLQFRDEYSDAHRAYMRDLQRFMAELAEIESPDRRETVLIQRREEISDAARQLKREGRMALGKNLASWSLGIVGSAWSLLTLDPIGAALASAGLLPQLLGGTSQVSAYSYVLQTQRAFGSGR